MWQVAVSTNLYLKNEQTSTSPSPVKVQLEASSFQHFEKNIPRDPGKYRTSDSVRLDNPNLVSSISFEGTWIPRASPLSPAISHLTPQTGPSSLGPLLDRLSTEEWYRYGLLRNGSTSAAAERSHAVVTAATEAVTPLCCGLPRHGRPVISKHLKK